MPQRPFLVSLDDLEPEAPSPQPQAPQRFTVSLDDLDDTISGDASRPAPADVPAVPVPDAGVAPRRGLASLLVPGRRHEETVDGRLGGGRAAFRPTDTMADLVGQSAGLPPKTDYYVEVTAPMPERPVAKRVEDAPRAVAAGVMDVSAGFWGGVRAAAEAAGLESVAAFTGKLGEIASQTAESTMGDLAGAGQGERAVYSGLRSIGMMAPSVALGMAGGATAGLGLMGGLTAGQSYQEARKQGLPAGEALRYAAIDGVIEVATERIPMGRLLGDLEKQTGVVRTLLNQVVSEVPGEQVATLGQDFNRFVYLQPDATLADYVRERPSAAVNTLIATLTATLGMSAGAIAADRTLRRPSSTDVLKDGVRGDAARIATDQAEDQALGVEAPFTPNREAQYAAEMAGQRARIRRESNDAFRRVLEPLVRDEAPVNELTPPVDPVAPEPAAPVPLSTLPLPPGVDDGADTGGGGNPDVGVTPVAGDSGAGVMADTDVTVPPATPDADVSLSSQTPDADVTAQPPAIPARSASPIEIAPRQTGEVVDQPSPTTPERVETGRLSGENRELPPAPADPKPGVRYEMPAADIDADPASLQYRSVVNREGVDAERAIKDPYDPAIGGVLTVWKNPETGRTLVVNGHHRLSAAKRDGATVAVVFSSAPTAKAARAEGALLNLREDNTSLADAVQFMVDSGLTSPRALEAAGIGERAKVSRQASAIASLEPHVRRQWQEGNVPDDIAAVIGQAGLTVDQQEAAVDFFKGQDARGRTPTPQVMQRAITRIADAPTVVADDGGMPDMFGNVQTKNVFADRMDLETFILRELGKDKSKLRAAIREKDRLARANTVVDVDQAQQMADESARAQAVLDTLMRSKGPISDILNAAAGELAEGGDREAIRARVLRDVTAAAEAELSGSRTAGRRNGPPRRRTPAPAGRLAGGDGPAASGVGTGRPAEDTAQTVASPASASAASTQPDSVRPTVPDTTQPTAAPQPVTAETLADALNASEEQGVAMFAILESTLMDKVEDLQVAKGGEPGAEALRQAPVATLRGDELGAVPTADNAVQLARDWFKAHLQGRQIKRPELPTTIRLTGKTLNEVRRGMRSDPRKAQLLPSVVNVLKDGVYLGREGLRKPRRDSIVAFHRFEGVVNLAGDDLVVTALVGEDDRGNLLYDIGWPVAPTAPGEPRVSRGAGAVVEDVATLEDRVSDPDADDNLLYQSDILPTGETQPRLPDEVGAVRDMEVPTPREPLPEREFRLTAPEVKPRRAKQPVLFQIDGQSIEWLNGDDTDVNASGESAASAEAINRVREMKAKGETFAVRSRGGSVRPLIGPEAVDFTPGPNQDFGIQRADGSFQVLTRGSRILYQEAAETVRSAETWYYDNILEALKTWQAKGTAEQVIAHLKKTKGAMDEAKDIGLDRWLSERQSVTRDDVRSFVEANRVEIEEVTLPRDGKPEYANYQLGGPSRDYREILLKLPVRSKFDPSKVRIERNRQSVTQGTVQLYYENAPIGQRYSDEGTVETNWRHSEAHWLSVAERLFNRGTRRPDGSVVSSPKSGAYVAPHFKDHGDNLLAHARVNDRTLADGRRVLFVEEIQSDWHQEGRKKGYRDEQKQATVRSLVAERDRIDRQINDAAGGDRFAVPAPELVTRFNELQAQIVALGSEDYANVRGVPDAPFKGDSWKKLALKRVLAYAAEGGYDGIAWTTGAMQNDRYDLSKQISAIRYFPKGGPRLGRIIAWDLNGKVVLDKMAEPDELPDIIGKDVSDKLLATEPSTFPNDLTDRRPAHYLAGLDLKVGGTGMVGFYDRELVNFGNDLAKRYGQRVSAGAVSVGYGGPQPKVVHRPAPPGLKLWEWHIEGGVSGEFNQPFQTRDEAEAFLDQWRAKQQAPVHVLATPQEMRDQIRKHGLPLFQRQSGPSGAKGSVEFLEDGKALIRGFKSADVSTGVHELAHVARRWLLNREVPAEHRRGISDEDISIAEQWAGAKDGVWSVKAEEKFARGFERFLRDGGPTLPGKLKAVFQKMAAWLSDIYQSVEGSAIDIEISPEMRQVYEKLVTRQERVENVKPFAPKSAMTELVNRYKPGNPFAEKAARARLKADRLNTPTAQERSMANAFPLGAGRGGPPRAGAAKRIDASVNRSVAAVEASKEADILEAKARAFDEGRVNAQGRSIDPRRQTQADQRKAQQGKREERIAAAKAAREGKERWEVTPAVYADSTGSLAGSARNLVLNDHREYVERAVAEGKPVPAEVLAFYPDIAPSAAVDTLDTGEGQTRLPGEVGNVRDEERAQPTETAPEQTLILTAQQQEPTQAGLGLDPIGRIEADAKARMKARGTTSVLFQSDELPMEDRQDLIVIGTAKIARGLNTREAFDKAMLSEFGTAIRPALGDIFAQAKERAALVRKHLDEDDYFNFRRVDISDGEKAELRGLVAETIIRTGRLPKERESWETIREDAAALHPKTVEHLSEFQKVQAPFRAVRLAARERINALNREIIEGRKKLEGLPPEAVVERERVLAQKERDVQGLLDTWMRMRSEDGRNLAMHRMMAGALDSWYDASFWMSKAKQQLGLPPGVDLPIDVFRALQDILLRGQTAVETGRNPEPIQQELADYLTQLRKHTLLEIISLVRKAGLLTGPKTQLRNLGGNLAFQTLEELARIPSAIVDMVLEVGTGHRTVHGISRRAIGRASKEAATKGVDEAWSVLKTGRAKDSKFEAPKDTHRELNSEIRWLDGYANFVFRSMSASDRLFKSYAYRRSLEEQAALLAINQGVSPVELLAKPTEAMITQAIADAEFATFNNKNVAAEALSYAKGALRRSGDAGQMAAFVIDMTVPFANTPANIVARMLDYTPAGMVKAGSAAVKAAVNKGMTPEQQRTFSQAVGRGMTGSALLYLGWTLAAAGLASGIGGDDEGDRNVREAAGVLPGAVRIGDRWHQIAAFSPAGNIVSLGATLQRTATMPLRQEALRTGKVAAIGTRLALEQPMLKGMADLLDALQRPEARGEAFVSATVGSFVPTLVNDAASLFDPYRRDARPEGGKESLWIGAASRLPGLRNQLPPRITVFGDPQTQEKRAVWDPTIATVARDIHDDVLRELIKHDVGISWPDRRQGETREDYQDRVKVIGQTIHDRLARVVRTGNYRNRPAEKQVEILTDAVNDARVSARKKTRPPKRPRFQQ